MIFFNKYILWIFTIIPTNFMPIWQHMRQFLLKHLNTKDESRVEIQKEDQKINFKETHWNIYQKSSKTCKHSLLHFNAIK